MGSKHAVIIGSGIGGSAIGALLASQKGYRVTLIEKTNFVGGRFAGFEKDGFQLDWGCHMIANSDKGRLGKILDLCGCSDYVKWNYCRNPSPVINYMGEMVKFPFEAHKMGFSDHDIKQFLEFHHAITEMTPEECEKNMDVSIRDFVTRYLDNDLAKAVVGLFSAIYFVARDDEVPVGEYALCQNEISQSKGLGYPVGGTMAVPKAYCRIIEENGGRVITGKTVKKICVENNTATGIELADGEIIRGDVIISNAGIKDTVLHLVGETLYEAPFVNKVKNYKYSFNTHTIKIALDTKISNDSMVFFIGHDDLTEIERQMEAGGPLPDYAPHLMAPVISNIDPEAAPEGKQLIIAGGSSKRFYDQPQETWEQWSDAVMTSVKKVFPGIEDHILFTVTTNASHINSMFGEEGSVIGVSQIIGQVGKDRPPVVDPSIKNLYHSSADSGMHGIGGELAADAALILYDILE